MEAPADMNVLLKARAFALRAHGDQKYGDEPYSVHLDDVDAILIEFGQLDTVVRISGHLHDVAEDTDVTIAEIDAEFGFDVAFVVEGVTSEPGKNRKERNAATYPKIRLSLRRIILKLADRIANGRRSRQNDHGKFKMYQKEYPGFRAALKTSDPDAAAMWEELDRLMNFQGV